MKPARTRTARLASSLALAGALSIGALAHAAAEPPASTSDAPSDSAAPATTAIPDAPPAEPEIKEPEPPPPPPAPPAVEVEKEAAPPAVPPPPPVAARVPLTTKFSAEMYGFVELDTILDTTQGLSEAVGNAIIAKPDAFGGRHKRLTFGARNSRIGFKFKGPESEDHTIKSSAILEMDFLGNQPSGISESAFYNNPAFRIRHMAAKLETPALDFLAGQYWILFGWGSYFHPNTVAIQGVPAQVFSRTTQFRVSHSFVGDAVTLDVAAAAARAPQRDSALPDAQGGIRLLINHWKGSHTVGSAGTAVDAAGIGVSGVYRHFRVAELLDKPVNNVPRSGGGISIDAMLPIAPATPDHKGNALTLIGSYVRGTGINDLFSGLTGGIGFPSLPTPAGATTAPTYTPNIDPGLVTFDSKDGSLHTIDWQAMMIGMQYYLPPSGSVWISANYSHLNSPNIDKYTTTKTAPGVFKVTEWADVNLFVDITKAIRVGGELAWFRQRFVDESTAKNYRGQLSGFYIF